MKITFKHVLCAVMLLVSTSLTYAQNIVTGIVEAADGPLIGASVLVKGTTRGTITDIDGQYSIEANVGDELEFSYMGYTAQTHVVTDFVLNVIINSIEIISFLIFHSDYGLVFISFAI